MPGLIGSASAAGMPVPTPNGLPGAMAANIPGNGPGNNAASSGNNSVIAKNATSIEDKISDSAKTIVKQLDGSSDALTLSDLNTAQQTVARIEAMIEVEKHLVELEKIRNERNGNSASHAAAATALASAIPASALAPIPQRPAMPPMQPMQPKPVAMTPEKPPEKEKPKSVMTNLEISRITGANGKYDAVLRLGSGELKPVRTGDKLSDTATVRWISSSSVLVEENGETHTLHIKNVDAIFSAMR